MSFRQLKRANGIRSRDGFTMIELMVVVAIIIMASGIMAVSYTHLTLPTILLV